MVHNPLAEQVRVCVQLAVTWHWRNGSDHFQPYKHILEFTPRGGFSSVAMQRKNLQIWLENGVLPLEKENVLLSPHVTCFFIQPGEKCPYAAH